MPALRSSLARSFNLGLKGKDMKRFVLLIGTTPSGFACHPSRGGEFSKAQQPVAVILVLLAARHNLYGQSADEFIYQRIERIENGDNAGLFFEVRDGDGNLSQIFRGDRWRMRQMVLCSSARSVSFVLFFLVF